MDEQVEANPSSTTSPPSSPARARGGGGGGGGGGAYREDEERGRAAGGPPPHPTFIGKHKLTASISHLQNQINIIQKELNELETIGESSIVCKDLMASVESISDPLLPWAKGPADVGWDRWFRGAHTSRSHNRWI